MQDQPNATAVRKGHQSLYKIADALVSILARLDGEDDGEIPPDMGAVLDGLVVDFAVKVDNICRYRAFLEGQSRMFDAEADRLIQLRDAAVKKAEWLKDYIKRCMEATGQPKLETELFRLSIVKNSRPSIRVKEGATIPKEFQRVKVEFDGQAVYENWKANVPLPACIEVVQGKHLRIS
jgi:hypothetical protein